jgi:hypothetical protein
MGKRLIGKGMASHPAVKSSLSAGTLVIVAGTTNAYVAEEILWARGEADEFSHRGFRRGITVPPGAEPPQAKFPGDVIFVDGVWQKGRQIFDVVDDLKEGDVVVKGANAVNLSQRKAAVYIGDPAGGTAAAAIPAVVGRRVRMIVPVGLEKRVDADVAELAAMLNAPGCEGPRLLPLPGEVFTELDAIELLTGAKARLLAGGGVCGAEGATWIGITGMPSQMRAADGLLRYVASEPPCRP